MKDLTLITLNVWGGKKPHELSKFIELERESADIFCFQEVFNSAPKTVVSTGSNPNLFNELKQLLPGFSSAYSYNRDSFATERQKKLDARFGLAIFARSNLSPTFGVEQVYTYENPKLPESAKGIHRNALWVSSSVGGKSFMVLNVHGLWQEGTKNDNPERGEQINNISAFLERAGMPVVITGDLNMDLDTEGIRQLERTHNNLIRTEKIPTTRTKYYKGKSKFADYTFIPPEVRHKEFKIPKINASDHLPLKLNFSIK